MSDIENHTTYPDHRSVDWSLRAYCCKYVLYSGVGHLSLANVPILRKVFAGERWGIGNSSESQVRRVNVNLVH